jgi:HNH endonuclease/MYM-type Zinc finger with FCS sequence motif
MMATDLFQQIDLFYKCAKKEETVYGAYKNNAGREFVIIIDELGNRRTVSLARYLMEKHLGRKLDPETETVDHKDGNKDNNDINNLSLIPRSEHSAKDTRRVKLIKLTCDNCGKEFERSPRLLRDQHNKGVRGSFCSRSCAGSYSRKLQLGQAEELPLQPFHESEYFSNRDMLQNVSASLKLKYFIK